MNEFKFYLASKAILLNASSKLEEAYPSYRKGKWVKFLELYPASKDDDLISFAVLAANEMFVALTQWKAEGEEIRLKCYLSRQVGKITFSLKHGKIPSRPT